MPGYIYLLRMADGVYKVGRTNQAYGMNIQRFKSYPADSTVCLVRKYNGKLPELEKFILVEFRRRFKQHPRGYEYFTGSEDNMINVIHESFLHTRDIDFQDIESCVETYLETFKCTEPRQLQGIIYDIEAPFMNEDDNVDKDYLIQRLREIGYTVTGDEIVYRVVSGDNHSLKRFIQSDEVILDPLRSCPQIVFVRHFNQWCRRNEIGPFKFDEAFYQDVFSQHDVMVRMESREPFVFGLDIR
jgi:hypothetical protein